MRYMSKATHAPITTNISKADSHTYMKAIRFDALLKTTIWGGEEVTELKHLSQAPLQVGESWEISGLPGDETLVSDGEFKGQTLSQLIATHGASLVGKHNYEQYGTNFPLLVKFMSTAKDLSIQVHPDDAMAQRMGHPFGKSEMQYILHAQPESRFYAGFNADFSADGYSQSVQDGSLMAHLKCHATHAGDCFLIPAGHIHCIGSGNFLIEIQQSSNDTFRAYDFDRRDAQGQRRELHIAQAREALDFHAYPTHRVHYDHKPDTASLLVDIPEFVVRLYEIEHTLNVDYATTDSFIIYIAYEGDALLHYDEGDVHLSAGQTILFPASTTFVRIEPGAHGFKALETYC